MSLTNILIAINVIAFIWESTTGAFGTSASPYLIDDPLVRHGALVGVLCTQYGEWWRIVSGAFLHGGLAHVALNMIALYQVGNLLERLYGKVRFALVYAVALVGAGLAVVYVNPTQVTIGASGAIFGLFGALVAVGVRLGPRGRGLIAQVLPVIGLNLVFTFAIPNISAAAHIGGLITGFFAGLALFMIPSQSQPAYAYAFAPEADAQRVETIDQPSRPE